VEIEMATAFAVLVVIWGGTAGLVYHDFPNLKMCMAARDAIARLPAPAFCVDIDGNVLRGN
jgi:hypothetical protein